MLVLFLILLALNKTLVSRKGEAMLGQAHLSSTKPFTCGGHAWKKLKA